MDMCGPLAGGSARKRELKHNSTPVFMWSNAMESDNNAIADCTVINVSLIDEVVTEMNRFSVRKTRSRSGDHGGEASVLLRLHPYACRRPGWGDFRGFSAIACVIVHCGFLVNFFTIRVAGGRGSITSRSSIDVFDKVEPIIGKICSC